MATSPPNPPDDEADLDSDVEAPNAEPAEPATTEYVVVPPDVGAATPPSGNDSEGDEATPSPAGDDRLQADEAAVEDGEAAGEVAPVRAGFSLGEEDEEEDAAPAVGDRGGAAGDEDAGGEADGEADGEAERGTPHVAFPPAPSAEGDEEAPSVYAASYGEYEPHGVGEDDDVLELPDYNPETGEHLPPLVEELAQAEETGTSAADIAWRRAAAHRRHRRNGRLRLVLVVLVVVLLAAYAYNRLTRSTSSGKPPLGPAPAVIRKGTGPGYLEKGSQPSVLPGNLLIADRANDRLLVVSPAGQIVWSYPAAHALHAARIYPDEAFFTPSGRAVAVTEDTHAVIALLSLDTNQIIYSYGHFDHPGASRANEFGVPSAALRLANSQILVTDTGNCRIDILAPAPSHHLAYQLGKTLVCKHDPPSSYAIPESAFPLKGGGLVVTEFKDNAVDLLDAAGRLVRSFRVAGFTHLAMTNEADANELVAVDSTHPGAVEILTLNGTKKWLYDEKSGSGELDDPTFALVLPNQDVLVSDEMNDRVVVIDPLDNKIVWQYGHLHVAGSRPGYLSLPIGLDLAPPHSLLDALGATLPPK